MREREGALGINGLGRENVKSKSESFVWERENHRVREKIKYESIVWEYVWEKEWNWGKDEVEFWVNRDSDVAVLTKIQKNSLNSNF